MNSKCRDLFFLIHKLSHDEELTVNQALANELDISKRTLSRYLEDLKDMFSDVLTVENKKVNTNSRKPKVYRKVQENKDLVKVLHAFFDQQSDLSWILQMLHEKDPLLYEMGEKSLKRMISEESEIYLFKSHPFEILDEKHKNIFAQLKRAVKYHQYKNIEYHYDSFEKLNDVKCLKLVFTQNNWYLAIENNTNAFRLLRIKFIKAIDTSLKGTYQKAKVSHYDYHYKNIQNAMTLYDESTQTARIKASSKIAKYFKKDMKPYFPSQRFIKEEKDGSIVFTLEYTQPLEILPFIKQWLPDLIVESPKGLQQILKEDIEKALKNMLN